MIVERLNETITLLRVIVYYILIVGYFFNKTGAYSVSQLKRSTRRFFLTIVLKSASDERGDDLFTFCHSHNADIIFYPVI